MPPIQVSVIMPALNEQRNILKALGNTLQAFSDYGISGEVVVINDGSSDRTGELVQEIAEVEERVRTITHSAPQGVGASFWEGIEAARGEVVVMMPGDNENDPWETLRYLGLLDHVDIVIPFVFNKEVRSLFRNALSFAYRFIINTTFAVNFNYTNGTVLYRRSILKGLNFRSQGFFFQTDILVRSVKAGFLFAEVPYRLAQRREGVSKAVTFPSLFKVCQGYLRLCRDIYFNQQTGFSGEPEEDSQTRKRKNDKSTMC
jgi:glycosyltransferase involved in cell wall biosynthesis